MSLLINPPEPIQVFLSSAPEDKKIRKSIEQQMSLLQRQGFIQTWHEQQVALGIVKQLEIDKRLQSAQLVLLLISAHFMASEQCWIEMEQAMLLSKQGKMSVVPVLLRPLSGWQDAPFGKLAILPDNKKPISQWSQKDLAITNIVDNIRLIIEKRRAQLLLEQPQYKRTWETLIEYPLLPHPGSIQPRQKTVEDVYAKLIHPATSALVLTGIAGAGKSTLADLVYHYAEAQRQIGQGPFIAETLKLNIQPALSLFILLETLFAASGEPIPDASHLTPHDCATLLLRFLQTSPQPRLIILDKFESLLDHNRGEAIAEDVNIYLNLLNRMECRCKLVVVSRITPRISQDNSVSHITYYHTDGLDLQDSIGLLQNWDFKATSTELRTIATYFSGHAQSLTLLGSLLHNHKIQIDTFLKKSTQPRFQMDEITRFVERLYVDQLDDTQRALVVALSVFREPVPLNAALSVMDLPSIQNTHQLQSALESLLALHLLQENTHGYQLQSLIAPVAQLHFSPGNPAQNTIARAATHEKAAAYYLQQRSLNTPSQQFRQRKEILEGMEAAWHFCQAGKWQEAYEVIVKGAIFPSLLLWGGSSSLLELYLLLPLEQEKYQEPVQVAYIQKDLGEIYHRLGQKQKAQTDLMQALLLFQLFEDKKGEASTLLILGEVYSALQQKDQAQMVYKKALSICNQNEKLIEDGLKSIALNNVGKIYHEQGEISLALDYYNEALTLHTTISEEATTFNNLGGLYEMMGEMDKSHRYYQKALRFFQEIGAYRGEGSVLHNLGRIYYNEEKIIKAQEHHEQALRLFHQIGDRWSERLSLENLCSVYLSLEQYTSALSCLVQIKKISLELDDNQNYQMKGIISLLQRHFGSDQFETLWREIADHHSFIPALSSDL